MLTHNAGDATLRDQGTLARSSTRGPDLYFYSATPARTPTAVVGVVHGYGEYGGRYGRVMDAWAQRGIASVAIDLRGHGRAGGKRGYCENFNDFIDDVVELERLTTEKKAPAFLFGHSFGGLVAVSSVLQARGSWRALVLSAPLMGIAMAVPLVKRLAGRVASRFLPAFALPSGIRSTDVTHDLALAAAYDKDPLVFHTATARWFTEVARAQERAFTRAAALTLPLYIAMGTDDRLSSYGRARAFFEAAGARDKSWRACEGLFHEVLNEVEWRGIADGMADFILAHL